MWRGNEKFRECAKAWNVFVQCGICHGLESLDSFFRHEQMLGTISIFREAACVEMLTDMLRIAQS
jgi:hypothetical protein